MWKARGKRGPFRRPPTTPLENRLTLSGRSVSHSRLENRPTLSGRSVSHSSHSPDDDDFGDDNYAQV